MKSTAFYLDTKLPTFIENEVSENRFECEITIPLLPAFAVEYFVLQAGALMNIQGREEKITKDQLHLVSAYSLKEFELMLIIYYHGIREYALLFPWITDADLRNRLGEFYKEAEANFNSGAWLSFTLMCGAVFEGVLYAKLNRDDSFYNLIERAYSDGIIDTQTKEIMNAVREQRNLVHANKRNESYVSRADAMDTRTVLDKLIKES